MSRLKYLASKVKCFFGFVFVVAKLNEDKKGATYPHFRDKGGGGCWSLKVDKWILLITIF